MTRPAPTESAPVGHARWIHRAVERYERPLVAYARRILNDPERARDVVQESFLRLCREREAELDARLAEWLFTVTRNRALDVRAKETRMGDWNESGVAERPDAGPAPGAALEAREERSQVLACMDELPDPQREALRLKFQSGLSYKEIAGVTGQPIGTVGYLIHMGLRGLRERLDTNRLEGTTS